MWVEFEDMPVGLRVAQSEAHSTKRYICNGCPVDHCAAGVGLRPFGIGIDNDCVANSEIGNASTTLHGVSIGEQKGDELHGTDVVYLEALRVDTQSVVDCSCLRLLPCR